MLAGAMVPLVVFKSRPTRRLGVAEKVQSTDAPGARLCLAAPGHTVVTFMRVGPLLYTSTTMSRRGAAPRSAASLPPLVTRTLPCTPFSRTGILSRLVPAESVSRETVTASLGLETPSWLKWT